MGNLPPLPEPDAFIGMGDGMSIVVPPSEWARFNAYKVFTADQMRLYAEEAVKQERVASQAEIQKLRQHIAAIYKCASSIRARGGSDQINSIQRHR
jgi:hypothetical protein